MEPYLVPWIVNFIVILVVYIILGVWINKTPWGILIDSRQKMSLSRFQLALWTLLLLSALFAVAWAHKTLAIELKSEVWALMGITIGSGAGAVIVKGTKEGKEPASAVRAAIGATPRVGVLHQNQQVSQASLADMFKGEEVGDHDYIDIGKVQMFFFTLAAVLGYAGALWGWKFAAGALAFPPISQELLIVLGISHAGYLTIKSAPKTPTDAGAPTTVTGVSSRFPAVAPNPNPPNPST